MSQLLIEGGGPRLGWSVVLRVIHLPIPVYEEAVPQANDLHTDVEAQESKNVKKQSDSDSVASLCSNVPDIERDGHHCVEDDDVGPEGEEGRERSVNTGFTRKKHCERRSFLPFPECIADGQNGAHSCQDTEDLEEQTVEKQIYITKCF